MHGAKPWNIKISVSQIVLFRASIEYFCYISGHKSIYIHAKSHLTSPLGFGTTATGLTHEDTLLTFSIIFMLSSRSNFLNPSLRLNGGLRRSCTTCLTCTLLASHALKAFLNSSTMSLFIIFKGVPIQRTSSSVAVYGPKKLLSFPFSHYKFSFTDTFAQDYRSLKTTNNFQRLTKSITIQLPIASLGFTFDFLGFQLFSCPFIKNTSARTRIDKPFHGYTSKLNNYHPTYVFTVHSECILIVVTV